jgi:hypothetical protein
VRWVIRKLKKGLHLPRGKKAHVTKHLIIADMEVIENALVAFRSGDACDAKLDAVT